VSVRPAQDWRQASCSPSNETGACTNEEKAPPAGPHFLAASPTHPLPYSLDATLSLSLSLYLYTTQLQGCQPRKPIVSPLPSALVDMGGGKASEASFRDPPPCTPLLALLNSRTGTRSFAL
jgi:hypothetical protein